MAAQCKGITKAGTRCKITRNLVDGYCRFHRDQEPSRTTSANSAQSTPPSQAQASGPCLKGPAAAIVTGALLLTVLAIIALLLAGRARRS